jgi:hypothetical protein
VVTFDIEEGKDKITTEETTLADAASTEQVIAATPEQASVANHEQASFATTEQANQADDTEKPSEGSV